MIPLLKSKYLYAALLGIPAGYIGVASISLDRPERGIALFEKHCLPFMRGEDLALTAPLQKYTAAPDDIFWFDPKSEFRIKGDLRSCNIDDMLKPMTSTEQVEFEALTAALVEQEYPELEIDPKAKMGDQYFKAWMLGVVGGPDRWGISIYRFSSSDTGAVTMLSGSRTVHIDQTSKSDI